MLWTYQKKEELQIIGIRNLSFKTDGKAIARVLLLLANRDLTNASSFYWKSKQIERVCHSSKDVGISNISRMIDDAVFVERQVEILKLGNCKKRSQVNLYIYGF